MLEKLKYYMPQKTKENIYATSLCLKCMASDIAQDCTETFSEEECLPV